jgi:hypothetical protein
MLAKPVAMVAVLVGIAIWADGTWEVYRANTTGGAVLVVVGGLMCVGAIAWWRRDPDTGFNGLIEAISDFFSPAR